MKNIIGILLIFACLAGNAAEQIDTLKIRIAGIVEPTDSVSEKIAYVHVINLRTGLGTITDSLGLFRINIQRQDTLLFRSIGYASYRYTLPDSITSNLCFIRVKLSAVAYQLAVIDVIALSRQHQFRYDFVHLKLPDQDWQHQLIIPGVTKADYQTIRNEERVYAPDIGSPVSFIYSKFSKEVKSQIKLQELKNHEKIQAQIDARYNKDQLVRFTGYNDSLVFLFMRFLNYSESYLIATCEYDLYVDIARRMLEFEAIYSNFFPAKKEGDH